MPLATEPHPFTYSVLVTVSVPAASVNEANGTTNPDAIAATVGRLPVALHDAVYDLAAETGADLDVDGAMVTAAVYSCAGGLSSTGSA